MRCRTKRVLRLFLKRGRDLHLQINIISLSLLLNNIISIHLKKKDIHAYKVPSKYMKNNYSSNLRGLGQGRCRVKLQVKVEHFKIKGLGWRCMVKLQGGAF
jgi:hypothetical protein